jgi:hypothetical protein
MTLISIAMYGLMLVAIASLFYVGVKKVDDDLTMLGAKGIVLLCGVVTLLYTLTIIGN